MRRSKVLIASLTLALVAEGTVPAMAGTASFINGGSSNEYTTINGGSSNEYTTINEGSSNEYTTGNRFEKSFISSTVPEKNPDSEESVKLDLLEEKSLEEETGLETQIAVKVDGKESEKIVFYMDRDPSTNQVTLPEPVTVTIEQKSGEAIGEISTLISPTLNEDRERIQIEAIGNTSLSQTTPVEFSVAFVDKNIGDETDRPNGSSSKFYIQILSDEQGDTLKTLSVLYGADGFYTWYGAENIANYKGTVINKKYVNVGEVDLKQAAVPSFTIEHYYKPMTGTENVGIAEVQLNPDGLFTFSDGSTDMQIERNTEGWIDIPVVMKQESFAELQNEAASNGKAINKYNVLTDLVFVYDDGYMAGGTMNPLPLVYHIIYRSNSSGGSGGGGGGSSSGGGGGGGGSSSGGSSSGSSSSSGGPGGETVEEPAQTARKTIASQNDIGWITLEGQRYYMNAENQPVTDWLQWTDGKWYYFGLDGIMKTGWAQVDGKWYLLNQDGSMAVGLVTINQQWYLLNPDGSMATGWAQDPEGKWRYFGDNGVMATNSSTPDGRYVDGNGILKE